MALPPGYDVEVLGDELEQTEVFGAISLTAKDVAEPENFYSFVTARNDGSLTSKEVSASEAEFDVRSWPGDQKWEGFVTKQIRKDVPALEEAVGRDWPSTDRSRCARRTPRTCTATPDGSTRPPRSSRSVRTSTVRS